MPGKLEKDRDVLRGLASRYGEAAASGRNLENIRLWKALNRLEPARPMLMIDQIPWHGLEADDALRLQCTTPLLRGVEQALRRQLYKWGSVPNALSVV